jgi:topoisomerase-4 subunit B
MPNVTVDLEIEGFPIKKTWCYQNGMADYLAEMMVGEPIVPIFVSEKFVETANGFAVGEGATWALAWFEEGGGKPESYVNLIPTLDGGTHEAGLKAGVFEAIKTFADHHAILPPRSNWRRKTFAAG